MARPGSTSSETSTGPRSPQPLRSPKASRTRHGCVDYQWLDWGRDYYAAVSFSDVPDGRRLMIGWMNNWQYADQIPTSPWRSPMSLVREVSLHNGDGVLRLVQQVAAETGPTRGRPKSFSLAALDVSEGQHVLDGAAGSVQRIELTVTPGTAEEFGLVVRGNGAEGTRIGIRPAEGRIVVDRRKSGQADFHSSFGSIDTAPIRTVDGSYQLTVYVDRCSVEVFAQGGQVTLTELIFPASTSTDVSLYATGGTATVNSLAITQYA